MKSIFYVARFTYLLLLRDKIFLPAAIIGLLLLFLAGMASGWTVENYEKILYDIGFAGFHITGSIVAIMWGAKIVGDFRTEGAIELELSAPLSRSVWFLGKYFGLFAILFSLGIFYIVAWQIVLFVFDFNGFELRFAVTFGMYLLEWWVLASVAFFFSSFASSTTSLFCALVLWILGLIVEPIYIASQFGEASILKTVVKVLSEFWNLQRFNISDLTVTGVMPDVNYLMYSLIYGVSLMGIWLLLGSLFFSRRQLQ